MTNATCLAYASDPEIRAMASSGGCVKALLAYLLDSRTVDGIIIARTGDGRRFAPETIVTSHKSDLLTPRTNSVYYPLDPFSVVPAALDPEKRYAVTLLPCQVRRLRAMQARGEAANVRVVIELLCGYTPTPAWTQDVCQALELPAPPTSITYRGPGWPGDFTASGEEFQRSKPSVECWSPDVNRYGPERCKHCSLICARADMTAADPWFVPRATLGTGKTLVQLHTRQGQDLLAAAEAAGYLVREPQTAQVFTQHARPLARIKQARRAQTPRSLLVWYWLGGQPVLNFGEHFVELLLRAFGYETRSFDAEAAAGTVGRDEPVLMIIGSEFHHGVVDRLLDRVDHVHVWGQGNGRGDAPPPIDMTRPDMAQRITIHALRGPLTKEVSKFAGNVPLVDPGFLMPRFYPLKASRDGEVLFIPHYLNRATAPGRLASLHADAWLDVMIAQQDILATMARIARARFALVSSLHAMIFCLAYRVPCALALSPGEVLSTREKWLDTIRSLGGTADDLVAVQDLAAGQDWWERIGRHLAIPDDRELLEVFPFPRRSRR